jgi:hypothetical protein
MQKQVVRMLCALSMIMVAGACSSAGEQGRDPESPASPPAAKRPAFDPPRTFDVTAGVALPESAAYSKINLGGQRVSPLPILLDGTRAYVAAVDRMELVDLDSGTITATIGPTHKPALSAADSPFVGANPAVPPVLADLDGQRRAVVAFATTAPGQGTTPSRPVLEVVTVDTSTGAAAERVELDPGKVETYTDRDHPKVLGAHAGTVIVQVGADTVAVDLRSRRETWRRANFTAGAVAGDTVVGADAKTMFDDYTKTVTVRGLAADSGKQRWQAGPYRSAAVTAGSPKVVTVTGTGPDAKHFFRLLDAVGGKVLDTSVATGDSGYQIECMYDGATVTVCQTDQPDRWAGAFDDNGTWLWELPDKNSNRVAPTVTAAWHGAVYGSTANGPLVLDARTGADRETRPGVTAWLVNEYVAVASPPDGSGGVHAYRAIS